jgi:5-formyltetrahydrofolate cyclo-ligase
MAPDLQAAKRRLRQSLGAQRRAVARGDAETDAESAARHLLADSSLLAANRVAAYAALRDELPTRALLDGLAAAGKLLLLPRVDPDGRLAFCAVERWADLVRGPLGVLGPPEGSAPIQLGRQDVAIVPGVAFDPEGWRLGRGGGYYDRAFPPDAANPPLLVGFGYEFQVVALVPHGSRDRRMDAIVTERGIRRLARASP